MGQYRPEYEVGQLARDRRPKCATIDGRRTASDMDAAFRVAHDAGLWRFDMRV